MTPGSELRLLYRELHRFRAEAGRDPTVEELASRVPLSAEALRRALQLGEQEKWCALDGQTVRDLNPFPDTPPPEPPLVDLQRLLEALLSAFPTQPELEQMVLFRLGENLAAIAGGGPLRDVAFRLIQWVSA